MSQPLIRTFLQPITNSRLLKTILVSIVLSALSLAQPVSITDFRIPTSKYQRLTGNLDGYWNKNSADYLSADPNSQRSENSIVGSGFSYMLGQFSENRSFEVNANVSTSFSTLSYSRDLPDQLYHSDRSSAGISFAPFVRYSEYMQPDTWFWTAQAQGDGSLHYDHSEERNRNATLDTWQTYFSRNRAYQLSVSAGVGYGKMRDGQSIFAALRVLDKLEEDGLFTRSLTRDEILSLADRLARGSEYAYSQDRYLKYLTEDIFKTLETMGLIKGGVSSAYGVVRAVEVLLYERIEPRLFGWRVSASLMHSATEYNYVTDQSDRFLKNAKDYVQLQGDYGYPVSLNTQLSASGVVLIPEKDYARRIGMTLNGRAIYQVGERIDATLMYTLDRSSVALANDDSEDFYREFDQRLDVRFRFFIENNLSFDVSGGYQYRTIDYFGHQPHGPSNTNSMYSASFGLSYRFL